MVSRATRYAASVQHVAKSAQIALGDGGSRETADSTVRLETGQKCFKFRAHIDLRNGAGHQPDRKSSGTVLSWSVLTTKHAPSNYLNQIETFIAKLLVHRRRPFGLD